VQLLPPDPVNDTERDIGPVLRIDVDPERPFAKRRVNDHNNPLPPRTGICTGQKNSGKGFLQARDALVTWATLPSFDVIDC
jgi:hypothetical protein